MFFLRCCWIMRVFIGYVWLLTRWLDSQHKFVWSLHFLKQKDSFGKLWNSKDHSIITTHFNRTIKGHWVIFHWFKKYVPQNAVKKNNHVLIWLVNYLNNIIFLSNPYLEWRRHQSVGNDARNCLRKRYTDFRRHCFNPILRHSGVRKYIL